MNPSTAQNRLIKDILWSLILQTNQHICCKCDKEMTRETFSIEHVKPWLDSENPIKLFFDLNNISFSHLSCNISDARNPRKWKNREAYEMHRRKYDAERKRNSYSKENRKRKYESTGY